MGIPQELVDYIVEMLCDDSRALKACSLTCRAMLASARPLIHRTLCLTLRTNFNLFAKEKTFRSTHDKIELRLLSYKGERSLLQYTRKVYIHMPATSTPDALLPHIHYFQSLDRVHTLTIVQYDPIPWMNSMDYYKTCFVHFYPTLTSLTLSRSSNLYEPLLQFILQFPNLENLCLEWLENLGPIQPESTIPSTINKSPPFRGHLRLAGVETMAQWPVKFVRKLPNKINFRSVELEDFFGHHAQHTLNACSSTLEDVAIIVDGHGACDPLSLLLTMVEHLTNFPLVGCDGLHELNFTRITILRRLTLRIMFPMLSEALKLSTEAVSTITSPLFCEFVLELSGLLPHFRALSRTYKSDQLRELDRFLADRFADREDFTFIVRTPKLHDRETFEWHAREVFSSLANRGRIRFEMLSSVAGFWR